MRRSSACRARCIELPARRCGCSGASTWSVLRRRSTLTGGPSRCRWTRRHGCSWSAAWRTGKPAHCRPAPGMPRRSRLNGGPGRPVYCRTSTSAVSGIPRTSRAPAHPLGRLGLPQHDQLRAQYCSSRAVDGPGVPSGIVSPHLIVRRVIWPPRQNRALRAWRTGLKSRRRRSRIGTPARPLVLAVAVRRSPSPAGN
jgi:hypothetical protein